MTTLEMLQTSDIDTVAAFLYGIIDETEQGILAKLSMLGIEASLCTLEESLRIEQIKRDLLADVREVEDDT